LCEVLFLFNKYQNHIINFFNDLFFIGRFIDNAQYVLVIVTDKAIHIFGLSKTPTGIVFHDMSSDRYRANYSKKTVESIVGTEDGRIFLIDAGELCELIYEVGYSLKCYRLSLILNVFGL